MLLLLLNFLLVGLNAFPWSFNSYGLTVKIAARRNKKIGNTWIAAHLAKARARRFSRGGYLRALVLSITTHTRRPLRHLVTMLLTIGTKLRQRCHIPRDSLSWGVFRTIILFGP